MVRLTDRPDMTLDVYRGRKTTIQQQHVFGRMIDIGSKFLSEYPVKPLCHKVKLAIFDILHQSFM